MDSARVIIPKNTAARKIPAKIAFSPTYIEYGICGALGLLDQGISPESDMARACVTGGRNFGEGQMKRGPRTCGRVRAWGIRGL